MDKRVTVKLDADGGVAKVDVEGQLDPEDFVEETPGKPTPPPGDDETARNIRFWGI